MNTVKVRGPAGAYDIPLHGASLGMRVLQGMALPSGFFLLRLLGAGGAGVSVPQVLGMVGLVAVGGGAGGAVYYATDAWRVRGGMARTMANVLSLLVYCLVTGILVFWLFIGQ